MDIKELNKKQMVLITLLITFVVSIATGIVTVSLMQQMPKSVPQTINNVIQRTIEKVTTVQAPAPVQSDKNQADNKNSNTFLGDGDVLVSIYPVLETNSTIPLVDQNSTNQDVNNPIIDNITTEQENVVVDSTPEALGQGIIISDIGLVLVESSILNGYTKYKVTLNDTDFGVTILKKFNNGFTILKINSNKDSKTSNDIQKTDSEKVVSKVDSQ